jgi:hypothetical protein
MPAISILPLKIMMVIFATLAVLSAIFSANVNWGFNNNIQG